MGTDNMRGQGGSREPDGRRCQLCGARLRKSRVEKSGYRLWHCAACGLAEVFPKPSDDELRSYYRDTFRSGVYDAVQKYGRVVKRRKFERFSAQVLRTIGAEDFSAMSVLDVGCGDGIFLQVAFQRGATDIFGIDISEAAVDRAGELMGRENVFCGTLQEYAGSAQRKYSLVTLFDVVEHVRTLDDFMASLRDVVDAFGYVAITTPYWDTLLARSLASAWPYFTPPEHLTFFSGRSMRFLCEKYGFRLLDERLALKYFSFRYVSEVGKYLMPSFARIPLEVAGKLSGTFPDVVFPLYVGERLAVLQKN
jgi:SAM-dependent methyltransferase